MSEATVVEAAATEADGIVVRRIAANGVALFFAWLLPRLATSISVLIAARVLGAGQFGVWGTAAAYAVILSIVATLGMQPLLVREMARSPERTDALVAAADRVKAAAIVLMLVLLYGLSGPMGHDATVTAAALVLGVANAIGSLVENRAARVQAEERMAVWARASAANGLVAGVAGTVLVIATRSVVWYCVAAVLGQLTALAWMHVHAPGVRRVRPASGDVARLLRALAPFTLAFIALTLHSKIAVLLLARWRESVEVGAYVAAYKFLDIAQALILVAVAAVYPRLSRTMGNGSNTGAARLSELLLLAITPAAAALWLARAPAVQVVLGDGYASSIGVLALLAPGLPALAVNVSGAWVLAAAGRMRAVATMYAGAVILDIALCALWIPVDGAIGAARALLVSECVLGIAMFAMLHAGGATVRRGPVIAAGAIALGTAALVAAPDPTGGLLRALAVLPVTLGVYAAADAIPERERALLRSALRRAAP